MGCSAHLWFNLLPFRRAAANRTLQKRLHCMTDAMFLSLVIQGWANPLQQGRTHSIFMRGLRPSMVDRRADPHANAADSHLTEHGSSDA